MEMENEYRFMSELIIIGAGGHGRVVADIAKLNGYSSVMFLDDNVKKAESTKNIVGKICDIDKFKYCDFFVAIGNNSIREKMMEELKNKSIHVVTLIHPDACISENVSLGGGTVVMAGAVVNAGAKIGKGNIINTSSSVDHDCYIGDFSHVSVGAHLAGTVKVGNKCLIGAGATIINNINISENCIIGAGSVVIKDIDYSCTVVGNPCRILK